MEHTSPTMSGRWIVVCRPKISTWLSLGYEEDALIIKADREMMARKTKGK